MLIIGCDYHPSFQQIAFVDTETGEGGERRLTLHFDIYKSDMIHEVPDYPAATAAQKLASSAITQAGALARIPRPKPISIARPRPPIVAAQPEPARPKPPARVKPAPSARNVPRRRSG